MSTRVPITFKDGIHSKLVAQAKLKERTLSEHVNILLDDVFSGKLIPPQLAQARPSPQFAPAPAHHADLPLVTSKHKDRGKHPPREWQGKLWEFGTWGYSQHRQCNEGGRAEQPRGWYMTEDGKCQWWAGADSTYEEREPTPDETNSDPVILAQRAARSVTDMPEVIPLTPENYTYYPPKSGAMAGVGHALQQVVEVEDPDEITVAPKRGVGADDFLLD